MIEEATAVAVLERRDINAPHLQSLSAGAGKPRLSMGYGWKGPAIFLGWEALGLFSDLYTKVFAYLFC